MLMFSIDHEFMDFSAHGTIPDFVNFIAFKWEIIVCQEVFTYCENPKLQAFSISWKSCVFCLSRCFLKPLVS